MRLIGAFTGAAAVVVTLGCVLGVVRSRAGVEVGWGTNGAGAAAPHAIAASGVTGAAPDFNREVRPILADHCFRCHGPDAAARKAGLRLDTLEGATKLLKSGARAVSPGHADESELLARVVSEDPDEVMPPPATKMPVSAEQREVLARWIESGAVYQPHWAFIAPVHTEPPAVKLLGWGRDPIDGFVLGKLEGAGLSPAPEADRATLLRRVSLVLTGLPPTPEKTAEFVADRSADAYEKQVDRLLASPAFGERMAVDWLDAARFADTYGYQSDWDCRVWPWRDWVIGAFNADKPYDEFVREQLAGDLMPGATDEQRLATVFNRLHRQTNEGGSIEAEFRQEYVSDRVHTFGTAMLGMTLECARCHDHKYEPILQKDYYSLCALFGSIDEAGTYPYITGATPPPTMRLPTREQREKLAELDAGVARALEAARVTREAGAVRAQAWVTGTPEVVAPAPVLRDTLAGDAVSPAGPARLFDGDTGVVLENAPRFRRCDAYSLGFWMKCPETKARAAVIHTSQFTIESDEQGFQVMLKDGRLCWEVIHVWPGSAAGVRTVGAFPLDQWVRVCVTYDGSSRASGLKMYFDGEEAPTEVEQDSLNGIATARPMQVGFRDRDIGFKGGAIGDLQVFDRALTALEVRELGTPGAIAAAIEKDRGAVGGGAEISGEVREYVLSAIDKDSRAAEKALREARGAQQDVLESIPEIMVMAESTRPRDFFVMRRGRYDDPDPEQPVGRDRAIEAVMPMKAEWPKNRLGLAAWATDGANPLVARVQVNRLWGMCFGRGLVTTQENFGTQGEAPSHAELLDTLAADFVSGGWKIKSMLRRIVLSAAFRQSSVSTAQKTEADPLNVLLSRGPAVRLTAEMMRDQALAASGLLVEKVGGPSVRPWQPPGLWEDAGANAQGNGGYVPDTGEGAHRRSLYTYRKRTAPPPNMLAFDSGSREQCLARRQATSTPLQPLVLLNDQVFWECARALAKRVATEVGGEAGKRVERAFVLVAGRSPRAGEVKALVELYEQQAAEMKGDGAAARQVLGGESDDAELAGLTLVCSTLFASDQAVTSR